MDHGEFRDPRLVEVYDAECPWSRDEDFFVAVAGAAPVRVVDFGCGTGRLALGLAAAGHEVTGIDPAHASLDAARRKPGATLVRWVVGTASDLPAARFGVVSLPAADRPHGVRRSERLQGRDRRPGGDSDREFLDALPATARTGPSAASGCSPSPGGYVRLCGPRRDPAACAGRV